MRALALVVLSGCGRLAFDPVTAASATDGGTTDGTTPDSMSSSELVLHFPFDATLLDEVARGHDANCFGGPCPTRAASPHGMAAVFTGQECLQIPFSPEFQLNEFTATAWVFAGTNAADADIFSHPLDGATTSQNSFEMFFQPATTTWQFVLGPNSAGSPAVVASWHHLAATYVSDSLGIYIDGTFKQSFTGSGIVYGNDPLFIGCDLDNNVPTGKLTGQIDDVRLYNRALSAVEVAQLATE